MSTFRTTRRIEFRDTDAAGIAHFSTFINFMEQVEHQLLRELGTSVVAKDDEGVVSWPRVSVTCDFQGTVEFEDVLDVELTVARLGTKSVTYQFRFSHEGQPVAEGKMTSVFCRILASARPRSLPIPPALREKLQPYVEGDS